MVLLSARMGCRRRCIPGGHVDLRRFAVLSRDHSTNCRGRQKHQRIPPRLAVSGETEYLNPQKHIQRGSHEKNSCAKCGTISRENIKNQQIVSEK
jgi:hypothetical protein